MCLSLMLRELKILELSDILGKIIFLLKNECVYNRKGC